VAGILFYSLKKFSTFYKDPFPHTISWPSSQFISQVRQSPCWYYWWQEIKKVQRWGWGFVLVVWCSYKVLWKLVI